MTITTELSEIVPERIDYLQLKKDTNFIPVITHFMLNRHQVFPCNSHFLQLTVDIQGVAILSTM